MNGRQLLISLARSLKYVGVTNCESDADFKGPAAAAKTLTPKPYGFAYPPAVGGRPFGVAADSAPLDVKTGPSIHAPIDSRP